MDQILLLTVLITVFSGIISSIVIRVNVRKENQNIILPVFWVIIFLNLIWYSALLLDKSKSIHLFTNIPILELAKEITLFSLLFVMRILFLVSFLKLFDILLGLRFFEKYRKAIKTAGIVIISIWFLGWAEVYFLNRDGIVNNFMTYTDILIFVTIITSCIYLFNRAKSIVDTHTKKAVRALTLILFIPLVSAHLKWLLTSSIGSLNELWEKIFLHFFISLINILMIWWVIFYGKKLRTPVLFELGNKDNDTAGFKQKYEITNRELEIVQLISRGYTNKEIAGELFISIDTVKDHNYNIFRKTGTKNRTQLANLFSNQ